MKRLFTLILYFYRPLCLWNSICSVLGLVFIMKYGIGTIGNSLLLKLMGYLSSMGYQYYMDNKSYFYFRNAGSGVRRMYSYAFLFDLLLYLLLITLYTLLNYGYTRIKG